MFKFLGGLLDSNEKEIKRLTPYVNSINELEPEFEKLSDAELKARSESFKARIKEATAGIQPKLEEAQKELEEARKHAAGATWDAEKDEAAREYQHAQDRIAQIEKERRKLQSEALDGILPEAFAAVREAAKRTIKQRAFDVQLLGGVALHQGKIAEMKTGEGKTLTATFPLYLNALTGRGAHLVTVNDYLARFHAYWMGPIFHMLGMSVAAIYPMQTPDEHQPARLFDPDYDSGRENDPWRKFLKPISRKEAYEADITYGTAAEFGFDFLRDNMVADMSLCVQRPLYYAIVDEVDNLLIDEARTPLIISAPDKESGENYKKFARIAKMLKPGEDYEVKAKEESADLNEQGWDKVEGILKREGTLKSEDSLYHNGVLMHHLRNALRAREFYRKDQRYVVENGEVIIVDEFTGRKMYGRRYSEGLHQAIEAKEGIRIQEESKTYATITIQNYFRMYEKLGGMTGTALTEAEEFFKIYKLEVTEIPTNKPMVREDLTDQIYKTEAGKFRAVVKEIKRIHETGAPVLIGTVSIDKSEMLADMLKRQGVSCHVLNAKEHTREAQIVKEAGKKGSVTVATNMAGRGVDIILGGAQDGESGDEWQARHDEIIKLGGLHIIGTERHEARRIDNQLRGRAGRQGDPGTSQFYVSLEDDIMRRFGAERIKGVMGMLGLDEETPIENKLITNAITDVQKRVEGYHFDMRKNLVEYDDVVNKHRELIYEERRKILSGADLKTNIIKMATDEVKEIVHGFKADQFGEGVDYAGLLNEIKRVIPVPPTFTARTIEGKRNDEIEQLFVDMVNQTYEQREKTMGSDKMRLLEKLLMLQIIDKAWVTHLTEMERMREQASLNTLRQMRSADAYKILGGERYGDLVNSIKQEVAGMIFHVALLDRAPGKAPQSPMAKADIGSKGNAKPKNSMKVGRNEPCPCGSGKKYKHCCGK